MTLAAAAIFIEELEMGFPFRLIIASRSPNSLSQHHGYKFALDAKPNEPRRHVYADDMRRLRFHTRTLMPQNIFGGVM